MSQEEDAGTILNAPRDYFQPDALDHVYRQVTIFLQYKRADEAMGRFLLESDPLRRKAGAGLRVPGRLRVEIAHVRRGPLAGWEAPAACAHSGFPR